MNTELKLMRKNDLREREKLKKELQENVKNYLDNRGMIEPHLVNIVGIIAETISRRKGMFKGEGLTDFSFPMVDAKDYKKYKAGLKVKSQIKLDDGDFIDCINEVREVGDGFYEIDLEPYETDADIIELSFSAKGANKATYSFMTSIFR